GFHFGNHGRPPSRASRFPVPLAHLPTLPVGLPVSDRFPTLAQAKNDPIIQLMRPDTLRVGSEFGTRKVVPDSADAIYTTSGQMSPQNMRDAAAQKCSNHPVVLF